MAVKDSFGCFFTYIVPKGSLQTYQEWYCATEEIENVSDGYTDFEEAN